VLKDLGLCSRSLPIKFIAFTANFLARTQPAHYRKVDSTTGRVFIQGYVSIKVQRIIWKPHGVSRSYTKDFVTYKLPENEKIVKDLNDVPVGAKESAEDVKLPL